MLSHATPVVYVVAPERVLIFEIPYLPRIRSLQGPSLRQKFSFSSNFLASSGPILPKAELELARGVVYYTFADCKRCVDSPRSWFDFAHHPSNHPEHVEGLSAADCGLFLAFARRLLVSTPYKSGAGERSRTSNLWFTKPLLCH